LVQAFAQQFFTQAMPETEEFVLFLRHIMTFVCQCSGW
jgi:hypothetical protein